MRPWARPALAAAAMVCLGARAGPPAAAVPQGVWLIDNKAAVQIYDCAGLMCGRILWLYKPRDAQGVLDRDINNPKPALRHRTLCGVTMLWGLHPNGRNRWRDGWFYNPNDGTTYRVSAHLKSDDVLIARIYLTLPLLGRTKTLVRVPKGVTDGWC